MVPKKSLLIMATIIAGVGIAISNAGAYDAYCEYYYGPYSYSNYDTYYGTAYVLDAHDGFEDYDYTIGEYREYGCDGSRVYGDYYDGGYYGQRGYCPFGNDCYEYRYDYDLSYNYYHPQEYYYEDYNKHDYYGDYYRYKGDYYWGRECDLDDCEDWQDCWGCLRRVKLNRLVDTEGWTYWNRPHWESSGEQFYYDYDYYGYDDTNYRYRPTYNYNIWGSDNYYQPAYNEEEGYWNWRY